MFNFMKTKLTVLIMLMFVLPLKAQNDVNISGLFYGDYFAILKNHNETLEGENAFQFRRIYLTFEQGLSDVFDYRIRVEMRNAGDFSTKDKLTPFIKDAFLRWTHNKYSILFGISATPTWAIVERVWGYRSVEKTALDLQKLGSSREFGIAFKGSIDSEKKFNFHLMVGNGNGPSSEVGKGKKGLISLSFIPHSDIVLEGYIDFEDRPGGKRRITTQAFAGIEMENFRTGVQFAHQSRRVSPNADDLSLRILSLFAIKKLSDKTWGFARYDRMFDPNPDGESIAYIPFDPTADSNFFLAGIDIKADKDISIIPNIEAVFYGKDSGGNKPNADIIARFTIAVFF